MKKTLQTCPVVNIWRLPRPALWRAVRQACKSEAGAERCKAVGCVSAPSLEASLGGCVVILEHRLISILIRLQQVDDLWQNCTHIACTHSPCQRLHHCLLRTSKQPDFNLLVGSLVPNTQHLMININKSECLKLEETGWTGTLQKSHKK